MPVHAEMKMLRFDDIASYAEARQLARQCRELVLATRHVDQRLLLQELTAAAIATLAATAEALRAGAPTDELRHWRDAELLLGEVRVRAYEAYVVDALAAPAFDELMAAAARTRAELDRSAQWSRRRARLAIEAA